MEESEEAVVKLVEVFSEIQASLIVNALTTAGIEAKMTGGLSSEFRTEVPGVMNILVHQKDLEESRKIVQEVHVKFTDEDWSKVDVGDPVD